MPAALSFEQMPAVGVPLRFLLSAPLFGLLAALLLLADPQALFASRWNGTALALTHLLVLGFLSLCMVGALLQVLPVVCGIPVAGSARRWSAVHAALCAGTLLLAAGFLAEDPILFRWSVPLLAVGFSLFLIPVLAGAWRRRGSGDVTQAIGLALLALVPTVVLGLVLAASFAGWVAGLPLLELTAVHLGWGAAGWIGLLVLAIACQVMPMFQATPNYPVWVARRIPVAVFLLLLALSVASAAGSKAVLPVQLACAFLLALFAMQSLRLLRQRKRPRPDVTTLYWWLAMGSLILALAAFAVGGQRPSWAVLIGTLFIVGFGMSAVTGMLFKIVPFLCWYHAQDQAGLLQGRRPPALKHYLEDAVAKRQWAVQAAATLMMLAACVANLSGQEAVALWLARTAGIMFALAMAWLLQLLWQAVALYRRTVAPAMSPAISS